MQLARCAIAAGIVGALGCSAEHLGGSSPGQAEQAISEGTEAPEGEWPTVVSVVYDDAFVYPWHCGGTLIGPRWVLTAGHCIVDGLPSDYEVFIGRHDITSNDGLVIGVADIIPHPDFVYPDSRGDFAHDDIALLELESDAPGPYSRLVSEARMSEIKQDDFVTFLGWGNQSWEGNPAERLRMGVDKYVGRGSACFPEIPAPAVYDSELCIGDGDPDVCSADSGGPAFVKRDGEWFVLGVVSWSSCGQHAATFAYVPQFMPWVRDNAPGARPPSWLPSAQIASIL